MSKDYIGSYTLQDFNDTTFFAEYSTTGLEGSWHSSFQTGDLFMRTKTGENSWSQAIRIVGEDGVAGQNGSYVEYQFAKNTSSTTPPTTGWVDSPPAITSSEYLWMRMRNVDGEGVSTDWSTATRISGEKGPQGIQGPAGQSQWTHLRYSTSSSGNPMSTTPNVNTKYIGIAVNTSATAPSGYASYSWAKFVGEDGEDGQDGIPGTPGTDGTTYYTWIRYADSPTTGMSNSPSGKAYIGIAHNQTTATESSLYSDYTWSLIKGDKGDTGASGQDAITILLSNESHTFAGNISNALASSTVVSIIAYKGTTRVASTIGTITGHVDGLTTSIAGNGTTSNAFTVSATTALKTANGVLTIPITVDGKSFTKNFSFAVSFKGATGSTGDTGASGADAKVITLTASAQIFTKPKTGSVTPSTITVTGTTQNITIATWQYSTNGGAFTTTLPTGVTRSGNVVTINGTTMSVKTIAVKAFNGAIQDTVTIAKVEDGVDGNAGATGKGVTSITEEYAISTSKTTAPADASFSTTRPTWTPGSYIWTRSKIVYNNPTSTAYTTKIVSSEWEAVNEIQVGGRNLLKNSDFSSDGVFWTGQSGGATYDDGIATLSNGSSIYQSTTVSVGDLTIASVKAKGIGSIRIRWGGGVSAYQSVTENYEVYLFQVDRIGSNNSNIIIEAGSDSVIEVEWVKLEKGSVATDWTPAPEDVDADIAGVQTNLTTLQSSLGAMAYEDAVEKTKLGTTIIEGGYLKTGFVDASRIDTGTLNAARIAAESIETTHLAANAVTTDKIASAVGGSLDISSNTAITAVVQSVTDINEQLDGQSTAVLHMGAELTLLKDNISMSVSELEIQTLGLTDKTALLEGDLENFQNEYDDSISDIDTRILGQSAEIDVLSTEIASKVSKTEYDSDLGEVNQNYVELKQGYDDLKLTIQDGGGSNIIKNSVGYGGQNFWTMESGTINPGQSTWILDGVAKYGWIISTGTMYQSLDLFPNTEYTISGRLLKATQAGTVMIGLYDFETNDLINTVISKGLEVFDGKFSLQFNTLNKKQCNLRISVLEASAVTPVEITDLMLAQGQNYDIWSQASGEIYTLNVRVDGKGINVHSADGVGRTVMSPEEFAGYYNNQKIFTLNGDITEVMGLNVGGKGLFIAPVKFVQTQNSLDIVWTGGN